MSEELRDMLAEILSAESLMEYTDEYPGIGTFQRLADECVRQMSWSRLEGINAIENATAHNERSIKLGITRNLKSISLTGDLTLAPKDWKPR